MFEQNKQAAADKVNMSLDDIIKMNKKQSRSNKKPKHPQTRLNNTNNNGRPNQQQRRQSNRDRQKQKPFGMLNRSKAIQKKRVQSIGRPQPQQVEGFKKNKLNKTPIRALMIAKRRRVPNAGNKVANQFNRFGSNNIKSQVQTIKIIKPAANVTTKQQHNNNNMLKSPKKPATPKRIKQAKELRQSKIAMLSARKNVQKAKKLLIARKQPQLMTQRYASKLGLAAKVPNQKVKPIKPLQQRQLQQQQQQKQPRARSFKLPKRRPVQKKQQQLQQPKKRSGKGQESQRKPKMITVSIANKQNNISRVKPAAKQQQTKRPILNRTRAQEAPGITSSRMVFF